jgi:hypothetical protein
MLDLPTSAAIRPAMTVSRCAPRRCFFPVEKASFSVGPWGPGIAPILNDIISTRTPRNNLVAMVIKEYRHQHDGQPPAELFLHAKSAFTDEERKGFMHGAV